MPTIKLTQAAVDRLSVPKGGRVEYFDRHLPGFGLRVSSGGKKTWIVLYRLGGQPKLHRYTIGPLPLHPEVDVARELARGVLQGAARGVAPERNKPDAAEAEPETVESLVKQFIERHAKVKTRDWKGTWGIFERHVKPRWKGRAAESISRRDIREMLDAIVADGKPVGANRVLAAVRKMFAWAVENDILSVSPVAGIKAPGQETERDRVLSDDELGAIWTAAGKAGSVPGAFFKMLILTGQRRDEVSTMRWADLNLESKVWTLPRESTKGDRSHEVPLAPMAMEVLTSLARTGAFVFSTTRRKGKTLTGVEPAFREVSVSGYSKMKAGIAKTAGFNDWRIHDFRRTAGTGMARLGVAVSTISRVLNHKEGGVTAIYNRYSYLDEKRHALETWARKVESLVKPQSSNVIEIKAAVNG